LFAGIALATAAAGADATTTTAVAADGAGGAGVRVTSRSRLLLGLDIVHCCAQHGIEACIDAILLPGLPRQHTAAAGNAVTKRTSTAAIEVARRFVVEVLARCTTLGTPAAVSVFRRRGRDALAYTLV
jgi:hypothetical protein